MKHPYEALKAGYISDLARMVVRPDKLKLINTTAEHLVRNVHAGRYKIVSDRQEIPQIFIATSFEREASSDFTKNPAQGWPLNSRSKWIPHNGPFPDWTTAAIAAYKIDGMDTVGKANWDWPRLCFEEETINGFGYRNHGIRSPYLDAGTNLYDRGKFVADGVWDADHADMQLGTIPVARAMVALDSSLDIPGWPGAAPSDAPTPAPAPAPVGLGGHPETGEHSTAELQRELIKRGYYLGSNGADGNYGRYTMRAVHQFEVDHHLSVDRGYAGPEVWAALRAA